MHAVAARAKKVHPQIVSVLGSGLRQRPAHVIVGGKRSAEMTLQNMAFQWTVIGPDLWNVYFEDARQAINEFMFEEIAYADDLNAYRVFGEQSDNADVMKAIASIYTQQMWTHCLRRLASKTSYILLIAPAACI